MSALRSYALRLVIALLALSSSADSAAATERQVYAAGNQFVPSLVSTGTGDALRFVNSDLASHNVTSVPAGLFGTAGNVATGSSGVVTNVDHLAPGDYKFVCTLHPGMAGVLHVGAGGLPALPTPGPSPSPSSGLPNPVALMPKVPPAPLGPGDWPFYGHDLGNSRNGGINGPSWNEVATMGAVWSFQSTNGDFTGTPVVSHGTLVAASFGGTVFALDASTGRLRWARPLKQPINGSAAIANGRVFVPLAKPSSPIIAALSLRTGRLLWRKRIDAQRGSDVYGSPVVWHHRVYIGVSALFGETSDPKVGVRGAVVALQDRTGRALWKTYTVPPGHDGGAVWTTPAIDTATGRLYVGTGNSYHPPAARTTDAILALSARTGRLLAYHQATPSDSWNETGNATGGPDADFGASPQLLRDIHGQPLIGEGQKSGIYWTFDRRTLRPVWETTIGPSASFTGGVVGSTAYDGTHIYGPNTPAGEIWALDRTGAISWLSTDGGPLHFAPVSAANGIVYSSDMSGVLTARDASTGATVAHIPLGAPSWGGVSIVGGYVFAVTGTEGASGWIVAYRPRG